MCNHKASFRKTLSEKLGNYSKDPNHEYYKMFEIILTDRDPTKELCLKTADHFPVLEDYCSILESKHGVGLCFNRKDFLSQCVGKDKITSLNTKYKKIHRILNNIEKVIGEVPIVEELKKAMTQYQISVSKCFD